MRLSSVIDRVQDQRELVATEAGDRIGRAKGVDEPPDGLQDAVAGHVPERLVDDLEAIEIEQDDGDRRVVIGPMTRYVRDPVGQQLPVRETGRVVVQRTALRYVDQAGVLEPDRGESREAGDRLDVPVREAAAI